MCRCPRSPRRTSSSADRRQLGGRFGHRPAPAVTGARARLEDQPRRRARGLPPACGRAFAAAVEALRNAGELAVNVSAGPVGAGTHADDNPMTWPCTSDSKRVCSRSSAYRDFLLLAAPMQRRSPALGGCRRAQGLRRRCSSTVFTVCTAESGSRLGTETAGVQGGWTAGAGQWKLLPQGANFPANFWCSDGSI